ncbi:DUF4342 domain-containing protein [Desulfallas sp. Bu1-1]|uniref:DUF4342 domain-containing protein n=1 Tax=Desulfallas sp. Bu1-1 TaxID=2787620 RepID=UPI00189CCCD0|nr:DUF4342 domain-containing protein [Desulfallas sp. Bu1-1]MBF7082632.1 DUF4342 domain-containing protein [Desulfallas sp. Bu1-1]
MNSELEKIDAIRTRTGISYREAKKALDDAGGDVIQALINLEEKEQQFTEKLQSKGQDVLENIKLLLQRGQETRIKVKHGDRTVFEVPASVGAVGLLAALASSELAVLGALGTVAAMAKKYTLEIERRDKTDKVDKPGEESGAFTFNSEPLQ